jgi:hypothetical protein
MFCPYCGATVADNTAFCCQCGKNIQQFRGVQTVETNQAQVQQYQAQKQAARQGEIQTLDRVIQHFVPRQAAFDAYDDACKKVNHYARGAKSALLVWGCIALSFGLMFLAFSYADSVWRGAEALPSMLSMFVVPGALMIVGGILMKVNNRSRHRRSLEEYGQLSAELCNHYVALPDNPVGAEFCNPHVLIELMRILQSGRADTVKESLQCLTASKNQARIGNYLAQTQKNTAVINAQTGISIIFIPPHLL